MIGGMKWKRVEETTYDGNPVFRNELDGDLAFEIIRHGLMALPNEVEEAIRSGERGSF